MDMVESEDETVDCRTWTLIFLHYFVPDPLEDKKRTDKKRTDKKRTGVAASGLPPSTPEATGIERLHPRENGQRLGGGEWEETD
jgi:hypothetical protein